MNHSGPSADYFMEPGHGNFAVTIAGYDARTTSTLLISHCLGLGMAVLSFPLAVYICYDLFWVRRRHLFIKRKDRYRASDSARRLWKGLPKAVQSLATVFLWPLFYSPQPNECLVTCMAIDNVAALTWHILMLTDMGSLTLRSVVYFMCPMFASGGLLLHLVGIMRAIPVSSKTSLFVSQGSRWQDLLFRLKVPSPGILTAVIFVYALGHLPLSVSQAWRLGSVANWPGMLVTFQLHWLQWALWLALFSITATIYGLQLIWLLNMNAKDRKALASARSGHDYWNHGVQTSPTVAVPTTSVQHKLVVDTTILDHGSSLSGNLSPSPFPSIPTPDSSTAASSAATMSSTASTGSSATSSPCALVSASSPLSTSTAVALRKRPPANIAEAQRKRALKQVKQILVDSPAVTMLYVPIHILMVIAYGELATNSQAVHSWRFIVPVVANILAYAGAQLKVFLPLFIVVWRDRQARIVGKARTGRGGGNGT